MHQIAIAGASTLLGREVKDLLEESPLAAGTVALLDDDETQGTLDQVGDEVTFVRGITPDAFDRVDFTFFCGLPSMTERHWRAAREAGSAIIDLSGALSAEPGVLTRAPWLPWEAPGPDLLTQAVVAAHPGAFALALATDRLNSAGALRSASATVLLPASEFGKAALDELHQQTINLLSFQTLPKAQYDAQAAFNLLVSLGEEAKLRIADTEFRIRHDCAALVGKRFPAPAIQAVHAPVFHGVNFSIAAEFDRPLDISRVEQAFGVDRIDLLLGDEDPPSNLAATGQDDLLVRIRAERTGRNPNESTRFWIWAAADNLRLHARNAIDCAVELGRVRPKGAVQ